jgi:hypothetical protein
MDKLFEEILVDRMDKLCVAFETLRSKHETLDKHIQHHAIIEEMIDERFSLFLNCIDGQFMLINRNHGDYDIIATYDLSISDAIPITNKLLQIMLHFQF